MIFSGLNEVHLIKGNTSICLFFSFLMSLLVDFDQLLNKQTSSIFQIFNPRFLQFVGPISQFNGNGIVYFSFKLILLFKKNNMKIVNKTTLLLAALSTVFASCSKKAPNPFDPSTNGNNSAVTSFKNLKVSPSFGWTTTNEIILHVTPLAQASNVNNTLMIKMENGEVLFSKNQNMAEAFTEKILVPSTETKLLVSFGSIAKTETIINNQITFNYIVE